MHGPIIDAI